MVAKTLKNVVFYCYFAIVGSKNIEKHCVLLLLCYGLEQKLLKTQKHRVLLLFCYGSEQKHWKTMCFIAIYYILDVKGGAVWGPGKWDGGRQPGKSPFDKEI